MTLQRQLPFQRSKCLNKIPHESNCNVSNSANHHSTCEQSHGSRVKWSIQALPSFQLDSLASAAHHGYQHRRLRATLQHCIGVWHHHAWSQITGGRPKGSPSPTPIMRWVFQDHNETNPLSDFFFPYAIWTTPVLTLSQQVVPLCLLLTAPLSPVRHTYIVSKSIKIINTCDFQQPIPQHHSIRPDPNSRHYATAITVRTGRRWRPYCSRLWLLTDATAITVRTGRRWRPCLLGL